MEAGRIKILKDLRLNFLKDKPSTTQDYWDSLETLQAYDSVFARRILWKWQSVLRELKALSIPIPTGPILDYGAGTGVASESVGEFFSRDFVLFDRSPLALTYAQKKLESLGLASSKVIHNEKSLKDLSYDTLIASHIFSELEESDYLKVLAAAEKAKFLILVDAGTPGVSKRLIGIREELLKKSWFVVAPCTHRHTCPLESSSEDWCHFFAKPPSFIFTDSHWGKIAKELNIDLRSLPLSYLVMSRTQTHLNGEDRMLGRLKRSGSEVVFHSCGARGFCLNKKKIAKKKIKEVEKDSFRVFPLKDDPQESL